MPRITLLLALHNHQPVGNFDSVFRHGHDVCYRPLLETIADAPAVKMSLHHSGPLLDWLVSNEPTTIDLLRKVVERGQVEVLGGGFYEPMLAVLPERDALGQIEKMANWCEQHLGVRPRGMWLAERVWEPDLARVLARGGIEYTVLDDTHFRYAGFKQEHLTGHYITEKAGETVKIFPISQHLRYAIPFHQVDEVIDLMRGVADSLGAHDSDGPTRLALTYGDDGEKFGMWPGTYEWVFEQKWLANFFQALTDNAEWLGTAQLGEHIDAHPPEGRVYLPTASYEEMMEWSLPTNAIADYQEFRHRLEESGELGSVRPFVRGGIWQGFLAKYPESNAIHKKMIRVSDQLDKARAGGVSDEALESAEDHLYQAQCNCAYWHGLFGGLYLNWIRNALYEHLVVAETLLEREINGQHFLKVDLIDTNLDGRAEVVVSTPTLGVIVSPHVGGSVAEIDLRDYGFCPTDVVARRTESYHRKIAEAHVQGEDSGGEQPTSIHDMVVAKEANLERYLVEDRTSRFSFLDDVIADESPDQLLESLRTERVPRYFSLADREFELVETVETHDGVTIVLTTSATGDYGDLAITKRYEIRADAAFIACHTTVTCVRGSVRRSRFVSAFNFTLLTADAEDRTLQVGEGPAETMGSEFTASASNVVLTDGWRKMVMELSSPESFLAMVYPVETVTQSEDGFERTYQGTSIALSWPVSLGQGESMEITTELRVRPT